MYADFNIHLIHYQMIHSKFAFGLKCLTSLLFMVLFHQNAFSGPGDTTIVQTFVFGSKQDSTFKFPDNTKSWEKVWMYYTLKCNPAQSPACGEWDYLTYTNLFEHTKVQDSTKYMHPNFKIGNSSPDSIKINYNPTYSYLKSYQYTNQSILSDSALIGSGNYLKEFPLSSTANDSRTQFVVLASELLSAGLSAGDLTGLRFFINANHSNSKLKIKIKHTNLSFLGLTSFIDTGFTLVVDRNFIFSNSGWQQLAFSFPFSWNGSSNLLFDISYENNYGFNSQLVKSDSLNFVGSLISNEPDNYLSFDGNDYLSLTNSVQSSFSSLDSFVTIGVWAFGDPNLLPASSTLLELKNAAGTRLLNIHLPWSNSNLYWDAGASGTAYDRINKVLTTAEMEGNWVYWTFTKNVATGSMKIYKNGILWHSGTSMIKRMNGATSFVIGGNASPSMPTNLLKSGIDELSIWNTELSQTEIQQIMNNSIPPNHPKYANLLSYYRFDESAGMNTNDFSAANNALLLNGIPQRNNFAKTARIKNVKQSYFRPQMIIEQGIINASNLDSVFVIDSIVNPIIEITLFGDTLHPNTNKPTDTIYGYVNSPIYIYNSTGTIVDSILMNADLVLKKQMHPYWGQPFEIINKYELGRFITPYGNGLDLGSGFTWIYDVTEFSKLLKDSVHLSAGNWQELLDMKFIMIEGTPERNLLNQRIVYSGNYVYSADVETKLIPKSFDIKPSTKMMNLSITTTGHGMSDNENCAEFCPKTHKVNINGNLAFSQYLFRENCDFNPLFPQGGTWIFSRANWCPGSDVTKDWYELTPFVANHDSINVNYDLQPFVWNGAGSQPNYVITSYLFEYGEPNFHNNINILDVIAPNNSKIYGRYNPLCSQPIIKIKNSGSDTLKSFDVDYFVEGGQIQTFHWTGNLAFLASQEISLPAINWTGWAGDNRFTAIVKNPNNSTDEYPFNNRLRVNFELPISLPSSFAFYLKTNSESQETSWTLEDANGSILISKSNFIDDFIYIDTFNLANGCYTLRVKDAAGDGLKFWYNMPPNGTQTAGFVRLRNLNGSYIKILEADFGRELSIPFSVGLFTKLNNSDKNESNIQVFPNPTNGNVSISFGLENQQNAHIRVLDLNGKLMFSTKFYNVMMNTEEVKLEELMSGIYFIQIILNSEVRTFKILKN